MQPTTDDASHDEALTSRIAALNMLDLTLGHLDVVVGEAEKVEVGVVVKACGERKYAWVADEPDCADHSAGQCSVRSTRADVRQTRQRSL